MSLLYRGQSGETNPITTVCTFHAVKEGTTKEKSFLKKTVESGRVSSSLKPKRKYNRQHDDRKYVRNTPHVTLLSSIFKELNTLDHII